MWIYSSGIARILIWGGGGILKWGGRSILHVGYNVNIKCAHFQVFVRRVEAE